jgi:hypothetical protein
MPAHAIYDDLKPVQVNLDGEARKQLDVLVRTHKSNRSAVVRLLIDQAHAALFLRPQIHSSEEITEGASEPESIAA